MKKSVIIYLTVVLCIGVFHSCNPPQSVEKDRGEGPMESTLVPVRPGKPGSRPFWNKFAQRFIYAPAFDLPEVNGAASYRFTIKDSDGETQQFTSSKPWDALSSVWASLPEGYTTVTVEGLDSSGQPVGQSGERSFYRSPAFPGEVGQPATPYTEAAYEAFEAIYETPYIRTWLTSDQPDRSYSHYCYPDKVIGGLMRAMSAYSKMTTDPKDHDAALQIARQSADYLLSIALPETSYFANIPPTYKDNVDDLLFGAQRGLENDWFMTTSSVDAAFGFLDLYDVTGDSKYYDAAITIADMLKRTQEEDGTWPHMANEKNGKIVATQRLIPTWVIFFYDRLEQQYHVTDYTAARTRAWEWIVRNPLKTYQWDAQFEDGKPHEPYLNLAREQACDIAILLLRENTKQPEAVARAEELLRFAEDQFVVWTPVKDCEGWRKAITRPRENCEKWITPMVLEQYNCYDPVARSSAILINAYLKAYDVTKNKRYISKARALTNGLIAGQKWLAAERDGNGLIPTWLMKTDGDHNWINNSFYAAEAVLNVGRQLGDSSKAPGDSQSTPY